MSEPGTTTPANKPSRKKLKVRTTAREAIALAAEGLGGAERLIAWAKEDPSNEKAFWGTIYLKLLPLQLNGAGEGGEFLTKAVIEFVRPADNQNSNQHQNPQQSNGN
jgi:hypothetical protein